MKKMIAVDEDGKVFIDVDRIDRLEWQGEKETFVTLSNGHNITFDWNIDVLAKAISGGKALTPPGYVFDDDDDDEDINNEDPGAITW